VNNVVTAEDDDDGSGMGWVRKRREAREQEKKEREAQEADARDEISSSSPAPETSTTALEHITQAVTVPARHTQAHTPSNDHLSGRSTPQTVRSKDSNNTLTAPTETSTGPSSLRLRTDAEDPESSTPSEEEGNEGSMEKDEDESDAEYARKTSQSAGVEKISRHKD